MLPWKLRKRHILPASQNLLSVYFSLAKFQLVSCNLSLATIWQRTYTRKLPKLCSATLTGQSWRVLKSGYTAGSPEQGFRRCFADGVNQSLTSSARSLRLSKRQSLSTTTVLFRTTFTRTIKLNLLLKSNHSALSSAIK